MTNPTFLGLTTCPHHASGNVGDQLITESAIKIIKHELGEEGDFNVHFRKEEFSSRIEYLNRHDAIFLFGFPISESNTRPRYYRIVENLDDVHPPIIPIGAVHKFFPGTEDELKKRNLYSSTRKFLDWIVSNCPEEKIPVRTEWVGQVLRQNGYETVLTGDPAWYDPDRIGQDFHKPKSINRLVFTTPHSGLYVDQAKELLRQLGNRYREANKKMVLHSVPTSVDRELYEPARNAGFEVFYASHDTKNLEMYRESDLHVGYRKHGHLAHLRWRRPSVVLAEDSRAAGLNATLRGGGIRAFSPESGIWFGNHLSSLPKKMLRAGIKVGNRAAEKTGYSVFFPTGNPERVDGSPNSDAVAQVLSLLDKYENNRWNVFDKIGERIDQVYQNGMKKYIMNTCGEFY